MAGRVPTLAELTTMRVGGAPAEFIEVDDTDALVAVLADRWASAADVVVLGGGSNIVASDDDLDAVVVRIATKGVAFEPADASGRVLVHAAAGESWDGLVAEAVARGLAGVEAMSGIPGSVGAAPVQNIGAYGQELSDVLVSVTVAEFPDATVVTIPAAEFGLGYRTSDIRTGARVGVVLGVTLGLTASGGDSAPVSYAQLASALGVEPGASAPVAAVRDAVLRLRASKGMLLVDGDPDAVSAGSFFTNPIVGERFAMTLPADAPRFPLTDDEYPDRIIELRGDATLESLADRVPVDPDPGETTVKLSAAWLIEHAGVQRGFRLPGSGAAISSKHTLAIVNRGHATAADVAELARYVQVRVAAEFGVILEPEPILIGLEL